MAGYSIRLARVQCRAITDSFVEGRSDEIGYSVVRAVLDRGLVVERHKIIDTLRKGDDRQVDIVLCELPARDDHYVLSFMERDSANEDDLLGAVRIETFEAARPRFQSYLHSRVDGAQVHTTGAGAEYSFWLEAHVVAEPEPSEA